MNKMTAVSAVAITTVAFSLALVGCGSNSKSNQASSTTTTTTTSTKAQAKIAPRTQNAPGPNPTIASYIQDNGIVETAINRGDPEAPTINLPIPDGWTDAGADTKEAFVDQVCCLAEDAVEHGSPREGVGAKVFGSKHGGIVEGLMSKDRRSPHRMRLGWCWQDRRIGDLDGPR
jgi:hypothetical protein